MRNENPVYSVDVDVSRFFDDSFGHVVSVLQLTPGPGRTATALGHDTGGREEF